MAFTFALNGRHDLSINPRGRLVRVYGPDEVKQRILVALRHYWQEYFLNVQDGVPWYEVILGSKNKKTIELIIRRAILEVPGVVTVSSLVIQYSNTDHRHLEIYATVEVESYEGTLASETVGVNLTATANEFAAQNLEFGAVNWMFASM